MLYNTFLTICVTYTCTIDNSRHPTENAINNPGGTVPVRSEPQLLFTTISAPITDKKVNNHLDSRAHI